MHANHINLLTAKLENFYYSNEVFKENIANENNLLQAQPTHVNGKPSLDT